MIYKSYNLDSTHLLGWLALAAGTFTVWLPCEKSCSTLSVEWAVKVLASTCQRMTSTMSMCQWVSYSIYWEQPNEKFIIIIRMGQDINECSKHMDQLEWIEREEGSFWAVVSLARYSRYLTDWEVNAPLEVRDGQIVHRMMFAHSASHYFYTYISAVLCLWLDSVITGCVAPMRGGWTIFCHAGSGHVGRMWSAREKTLKILRHVRELNWGHREDRQWDSFHFPLSYSILGFED